MLETYSKSSAESLVVVVVWLVVVSQPPHGGPGRGRDHAAVAVDQAEKGLQVDL